MNRPYLALLALFALLSTPLGAQPLSPQQVARIDQLVTTTLSETGVPSAEIAVVRGGAIVLDKAYGKANEGLPARPDLPYQIASNSKQFTAMAVLLLRDEGKLSLDDPVSKYIPGITEGNRITIRELLSHTSGLEDFWPQDYSFADMSEPTTPQHIVDKWAKKPLDFEPGTRYQYSNTGYVVAGMIVQKVSGEPLLAFLNQRIFEPLGMHPLDQDDTNTPAFPAGYERHALGPIRLATPPAHGWLFAAGELSMNAGDLAKWDIARLNRSLIPTHDWVEQERPVLRADGRTSGYGLGVYNRYVRQRHVIDHSGEAVGFLTQNTVYPDTKDAIIVFTNSWSSSGAVDRIASGIEDIALNSPEPTLANEGSRIVEARAIYDSLVTGHANRARFTPNLNYYFNATTLADYAASLSPLGEPTITLDQEPALRGGFVHRGYTLHYANGRNLSLNTYAEPGANGRWEQFLISTR